MAELYAKGWSYADAELPPGWYAVLYCWDPEEGSIPGAAWWDGHVWRREPDGREDAAVSLCVADKPCSSKDKAIDLAYERDPDW